MSNNWLTFKISYNISMINGNITWLISGNLVVWYLNELRKGINRVILKYSTGSFTLIVQNYLTVTKHFSYYLCIFIINYY